MRTRPSVAQTRVPVASCGHLPDAPLCLESLARDAQRVLPFEPRPERQRDLGKRPIADVLPGERVLVHLRPEIARVDRDDANAHIAQLVRERLAHELERSLAATVAAPSRVTGARRIARDVPDEAPRF